MGNRRKSRECALKVLYSVDVSKSSPEEALALYWGSDPADNQEIVDFTDTLVKGVVADIKNIDSIIKECSDNWKVSRMAAVDRNILRVAIYEFYFCEDIPVRVTLNEAIELAKEFGSEDSKSFVNGILDKVSKRSDIKKDQ